MANNSNINSKDPKDMTLEEYKIYTHNQADNLRYELRLLDAKDMRLKSNINKLKQPEDQKEIDQLNKERKELRNKIRELTNKLLFYEPYNL